MNDKPNFAKLLDRKGTEVERPKPCPAGSYIWIIKGQPRFDQSAQKKTDFVEFNLVAQSALEDVDEVELTTWANRKDGTTKSFADLTQKGIFYLTEDSLFRLNDFLNACGAGDESMSLRQRIEEAVNCQVVGVVSHRATQDGEGVFAEIRKFAKVS